MNPRVQSHREFASRYQEVFEPARPYLDTRGNQEHTEVAVEFAWRQRLSFGFTPTRPDLNRLHEEKGAEIAAAILTSVGYDPLLTREIAEIVRRHDSRLTALSLNDSLVKDADKLFRLTRRGYYIFWEWFPLDYRQYLGSLAKKAGAWFFTATARRPADEMFADLAIYVDELEQAPLAEAASAEATHGEAAPSRGSAP